MSFGWVEVAATLWEQFNGSDYRCSFPKSFIKRHEIEGLKAIDEYARCVVFHYFSYIPNNVHIQHAHRTIHSWWSSPSTAYQHRLRTLLNFSFFSSFTLHHKKFFSFFNRLRVMDINWRSTFIIAIISAVNARGLEKIQFWALWLFFSFIHSIVECTSNKNWIKNELIAILR